MTWCATVSKGIPIPERHVKKGYVAALRKLEVGESVLIPANGTGPIWFYRVRAGLKGKSTMRREGEGYRVWRTA